MIYKKSRNLLDRIQLYSKAICNRDTTIKYPVNSKSKIENEYNLCLNNLTQYISDINISNERNTLFYKNLIEHSDTGLIAFDNNGYVEIINKSARLLIGVKNISNIKLLKQLNSALYTELINIKNGQSIIFKSIKIVCTSISFSDRRYKLIALFDIRSELERNEIESWQKLLSVLTHEMMNSIAPITSISNTLLNKFRTDYDLAINDIDKANTQDLINALTVIEERGKGLINFVNNYRKLAKIPDPIFDNISPEVILFDIHELYKETFFSGRISFTANIDEEIKSIYTDKQLLTQILINLINNSIDSFYGLDLKERIISVSVKRNQSKIFFEISDNGCGIDKELYDNIFVPFFTTKSDGNGIGLSLSKQIAKRLNARLYCKSDIDHSKGCVFVIEF